MVYSRGETTSFNPFWSEETETTTINTPAAYPSPFDQTMPLALSSIPVGVGGAGGNGNSSRSRPSTSRRGMASGNGSVMTTTSWADDFYWRTEETATTDLAWRVDTPTIASSRSSYYPHNPPVPHPHPPMVDTSLESQDHYFFDDEMYDYEKDRVNNLAFQTDPSRSFFPKIVTSMDRSQATTIPSVSIVIQERLSILFDGLSPDPSCRVMGRIYVRNPSKPSSSSTTRTTAGRSTQTSSTTMTPSIYHLIVHDRKRCVEQWTISSTEACKEDVEAFTSLRHMSLQPTDRIFRLDTSKVHTHPEPMAILEYHCSTKLKPIPMLIKTKLQRTERRKSHLGIRLRANPANRKELERLAILVVVPPHVQPDDPPPQGGIWDDVKRTLSWGCAALTPGQGMDLQITFHGNMDTTPHDTTASSSTECPFPILVHCRGYRLFSRLNVSGETVDGRTLNLDVQRATTVLYRKL